MLSTILIAERVQGLYTLCWSGCLCCALMGMSGCSSFVRTKNSQTKST